MACSVSAGSPRESSTINSMCRPYTPLLVQTLYSPSQDRGHILAYLCKRSRQGERRSDRDSSRGHSEIRVRLPSDPVQIRDHPGQLVGG